MVIVIAKSIQNDAAALKKLGVTSSSKVTVVSNNNNNNNNVISKTKDKAIAYGPQLPTGLEKLGINKPVVEEKETINSNKNLQSLIKSAYITQATYNPKPSGTAIPTKIVNKTVKKLESYGLDSSAYKRNLPSLNMTDKDFKTDNIPVLTDSTGGAGSYNTGTGSSINFPSIDFSGLGNLFSGVGSTIDKYVQYALIGLALYLGIKLANN